ncbi:unnamed protein product [Clonostachys chloroleuca]|uniref:Major facilitator superfamily (MFS) profile domain-containing protein n=1 Tax=Clonostachys chloroleuca TaxID=1926264 RepID=A0AA35Q4Y0_9HYPO|nr:unnamed protein product [Clonostachys chloroleuca]
MDAKGPTARAPEAEVGSFDPPSENAEESTTQGTYEKPKLSHKRSIALALVLASSPFLTLCMTQACVITLPIIGRDLNIHSGSLQWVLSAASVANACSLPLWGRLADIWGRRFIFQFGLASFWISCLIAPFAPNEVSFCFFRVLHGLGGAAAVPSAVSIIFEVFPPGKPQIHAMSVFSAGFPLGSLIGNILGGVIAQQVNWHWVFWIMSIATACSWLTSLFVVPFLAKDAEIRDVSLQKRLYYLWIEMDWVGLLLSLVILVLFLVSLTAGNVVGWTSPWVLTLLIVSCLILPVFIKWEHWLEDTAKRPPLIKLSIFHSPIYRGAQIIDAIFWAAFNNFLVFASYFYQDYQGLDVLQTTLRFLPSGIAGIVATLISSQVLSRVDGYYMVLWCTACISVACLLFAVPIPPGTTYWAYGFPSMILLTIGGDMLFPCISIFVMNSIPEKDRAAGAAVFQTLGQVGRSVGLAVATAIQIAVMNDKSGRNGTYRPHDESLLRGLRAAEWFNFTISVTALAVAAYSFRGAGKLNK